MRKRFTKNEIRKKKLQINIDKTIDQTGARKWIKKEFNEKKQQQINE